MWPLSNLYFVCFFVHFIIFSIISAANYLKGYASCLPGAPIAGQISWKLSFASGGCIDFGHALLTAVDVAGRQVDYFTCNDFLGFDPRMLHLHTPLLLVIISLLIQPNMPHKVEINFLHQLKLFPPGLIQTMFSSMKLLLRT